MPMIVPDVSFMGHKPCQNRSRDRVRADDCGVGWDGLGWSSHLSGVNEDSVPSRLDGLERLLSVEELSAYLGVPVRTLYDWRVDGRGPRALHAGRVLRYPESSVRAWIQENLDA